MIPLFCQFLAYTLRGIARLLHVDVQTTHHEDEELETGSVTANGATSPRVDRNDDEPRVVVDIPVSSLQQGLIVDPDNSLAPAIACRLRLIDAAAFLDSDVLRVIEYPPLSESQDQAVELSSRTLPHFAAVSYPWRDLQSLEGRSDPSFSVAGALHADPISVEVIRTACIAARSYECTHLWIDRLCILQTQKEDKSWQIQRMFHVYQCCTTCLVFPGGLVRLARLDEPTSWIDRAWTLQEAVAPGERKVKLVFELTHVSYLDFIRYRCDVEQYPGAYSENLLKIAEKEVQKNVHGPFTDQILVPGKSATANLDRLLWVSWIMLGTMRMHAVEMARDRPDKLPIRILRMPEAQLLRTALKQRGINLWIAAYTRSSSRPVDMVFSLMDLLGVHLDVKRFGKNDRVQATIAMIQGIMEKQGGIATWLFVAPEMDPSRELSTVAEMPETSESGKAYIRTRKGKVPAVGAIGVKGFESNTWATTGAPRGTMTDSGYFVFWGKAALLVDPNCPKPELKDHVAFRHAATQGASSRSYDNREVWAIIVGRLRNLNRNPETWEMQSTPMGAPKPEGVIELTLMLVERHGFDLYHRVGMEREVDERKTSEWSWMYRCFKLGGPGVGGRRRFHAILSGPAYGLDPIQIDHEKDTLAIVRSRP